MMGLDIGERRVGVAMSDPLGVSAFPLEVLEKVDPVGLRGYVEEKARQGVEVVVIGLPLNRKGEEGEQARRTREYARAVEELEGVEVVLWDERLSTVEAQRKLKEAGRSLKGRKVDAEAAAVILESYLDFSGGGSESGNQV
jgi:putative Holliday junction resolvase